MCLEKTRTGPQEVRVRKQLDSHTIEARKQLSSMVGGRTDLPCYSNGGEKAQAVSYDFISKGNCQELCWQRRSTQEASRIGNSCDGSGQDLLQQRGGAVGHLQKVSFQRD